MSREVYCGSGMPHLPHTYIEDYETFACVGMLAPQEIERWVDDAMYEASPMPDGIQVHLISTTVDPLGIIAAVSKMYEGQVVTDPHAGHEWGDRTHYWEEMCKTKLKAPMEFVDMHFLLSGVSRSFTHQMVRQRTAVYAQESLRFAVKENFADETPLPPSLRHRKDDDPLVELWRAQMDNIQNTYNIMVSAGLPAEDARGILPHQTTTRLHYKTNLRNFIEVIGNRLCTQAQFEWREVVLKMTNELRVNGGAGWQIITDPKYKIFAPACYQAGHCPFKADFDRGCTIRKRADAGQFDQIDVAEWAADPTAAYVHDEGEK